MPKESVTPRFDEIYQTTVGEQKKKPHVKSKGTEHN